MTTAEAGGAARIKPRLREEKSCAWRPAVGRHASGSTLGAFCPFNNKPPVLGARRQCWILVGNCSRSCCAGLYKWKEALLTIKPRLCRCCANVSRERRCCNATPTETPTAPFRGNAWLREEMCHPSAAEKQREKDGSQPGKRTCAYETEM